MNKRLSIITAFSTLVLASGCGSSGINGTTSDNGPGKRHTRGLCTASSTAPAAATGRIADFSSASGVGDQKNPIPAKIVTYGLPKPLDSAFQSYTTTGGHLNIKINAPATSSPQLLGTLLQFDSCIDASVFTGVEFAVSGAFSGCSLVYATGDVEHEDVTKSSTFASGPEGSYVPQHKIAAEDLSTTPRTIKLPFANTDIRGNPPTPLDPAKLIFTLWQFVVPVAADGGSDSPPCSANLTIGDIKFYR
jgi:hypothetical protein